MITTKDNEEFLISEMLYFGFKDLDSFKKQMQGMDVECSVCGTWHWAGSAKNCKCDE